MTLPSDDEDIEADRRQREQMARQREAAVRRIDDALDSVRMRGLVLRVDVIGRDASDYGSAARDA